MSKKFNIKNFEERLKLINKFDGGIVYGAETFHKNTNRSSIQKGNILREQHKLLIKDSKGNYIRNKKFWEKVSKCPVCNHSNNEFFLSRLCIDIYECFNCKHRFMNPRPKFKKAIELYNDDLSASKIWLSNLQKNMDSKKFEYANILLEVFIKNKNKKIIDIGCGSGLFLEHMSKNGWKQCVGVDVNKNYHNTYSKINGVQFINSTFEDISPQKVGNNYDCVSLWGVFEHLYDLNTVLKKIKKILKKNGTLFIMVPNGFSLVTNIIRDKSPTFMWKHLNHFSNNSLQYFVEKNNDFKLLHSETMVTEIENIKSYLNGKFPYGGYADPKNIYNFISPHFIHKNFLGSRLISIFKKI
jgi:2-polyprenyl-3-methyl-5-hydroxy-6-metoxy-1,4-benzoquinol methylase